MTRKRKNLDISVDDIDGLLQEIESMRPKVSPWKRQFTAEQDRALLAARGRDQRNKVIWSDLVAWWTAKWGAVNVGTLRARLKELEP